MSSFPESKYKFELQVKYLMHSMWPNAIMQFDVPNHDNVYAKDSRSWPHPAKPELLGSNKL
jgi:hypothetical protein